MTSPNSDPLGDQVRQILAAAMGAINARRGPAPETPPPGPRTEPEEVADSWDDEEELPPETPVASPTPDETAPAPADTPPSPTAAPSAPTPLALPGWFPNTVNSATFDLQAYLRAIPNVSALLKLPKGRRALTYADPLLFALVYLPHHLKDPNAPNNPPSFADCHFDWCRLALRWVANKNRTDTIEPGEDRIAEIAPRMCGKSTWWFLIISLWAAAHGHKRFIAAFASTATQAEGHLRTFKNEIDTNRYLREDFPDLCTPKRRPSGAVVADRVDTFQAQNGFVFVAKGIDSNNLGMKVEEVRPDLLLMDDIEPDERMYSADLAEKRLGTVQDAILQLNIYASVVFVGTVTMPNSIIHQIVKHSTGQQNYQWVTDEKIRGHHYLPIVVTTNPDGTTTERSLWPEKWPLEYLKSIQHTRSYAKNYANDPKGRDGDYWNDEDFTRIAYAPRAGTGRPSRTALFVDPPTTTSKTSDPAGLAVVTYSFPTPAELATPFEMEAPRPTRETGALRKRARNATIVTHPGTIDVRWADEVKLTGKPLAQHVYKLLQEHPEWYVQRIIVEVTQGGDLWLEVFADSPWKIEVVNPRESKELRFERALAYYQKIPTLVRHDPKNCARLEEQQLSFPKGAHDDIADAAVTGILYFLEPKPRKRRTRTRVRSYV